MAAEITHGPSLIVPPALAGKCRLIKLKGHTKAALEPSWNINANYSPDDAAIISHISSGMNYGIIPCNGLVVIDCDTEKLYDNLPSEWKASLTVITGRNGETGRHVFLSCPNSPREKFVIRDPETEAQLGDVRGSNSNFYTVGAGSIHPDSGRKYQYSNPDATIVEVPWDDIQRGLLDIYPIHYKKTIPVSHSISSNSLSDQLGLRIEDFAMPLKPTRRPNGDIQGSHPIHGSTTGMNFSICPQKNVWFCFRDNCGGDPVAWIAYAHCGVAEDRCSNLSVDEFKQVREWLKANGYSKEIAEIDNEYHKDDGPEADISNLIFGEEQSCCSEDIDEEIEEARKIGVLPDFPDIDIELISDYMTFGKNVSYSIPPYHFAAFITMLSMAIGRKVLIEVGMSKIYPNIFAMVIGHTTISGKSVACDIAVDSLSPTILHEEELAQFNSVRMFRGEISAPALVQDLNDVYNRLWYYDDCAPFLDNANGWNTNIIGKLCTIYDGKPVEHKLSRTKDGNERFWNCPAPFVSVLMNTTPKDLDELSTSRMFSSGLYPRFMWFIGQGGEPRKNTKTSEEDKKLLASIVSRVSAIKKSLRYLNNDSIRFSVSEEIEEWRLKRTMEHLGKEDEAYRAAISRGFIHAYKLAAIFTICDCEASNGIFSLPSSKYPIEIEIPNRHAMAAISVVDNYLLPRAIYVYNMCQRSDDNNHQVKVLKALDHYGGVAPRTKLLQYTHLGKKEMSSALATLEESGEIKTCEKLTDGANRKTTVVIKLKTT